MSLDDVVHRIGVLESRMDRVCKFLSGMYLSSYFEEFKSLEQKVMGLDKSLYERINGVKVGMEEDVKSNVNRLETKIAEVENEWKKGLAKAVFSIDRNDIIAQIKVEYKSIKEVSEDCLEGLLLIMKEYGNVSFEDCFRDCGQLTALNFPSTFDTSNVTSMRCMFDECKSLTLLDFSTFNTSSVTDMIAMFRECSNLSSLDLSTFNTSRVTNMCYMFYVCNSLYTLDLSSFDTSSVGPDDDYSGCTGMFKGCDSLGNVKYNKNDLRIKKVLPIDTTCEI